MSSLPAWSCRVSNRGAASSPPILMICSLSCCRRESGLGFLDINLPLTGRASHLVLETVLSMTTKRDGNANNNMFGRAAKEIV